MGLRERKKERTRDQLATAACKLFIERGYESTTVEDIAGEVEVSPRTFFRYYPAKVDVAVEILQRGTLDLRDAFTARPATEPLTTSLRAAIHVHIHSLEEQSGTAFMMARMLNADPALCGRLAELQRSVQEELTVPIAHRLGVDPTIDIRPRLIAMLTIATLATALDHWSDTNDFADLHRLVDTGFDLLESGLRIATKAAPQPQR